MTMRYYNVKTTKVPIGSAIEYREPAIQGDLYLTVTDASTRGDYKLFLVNASDAQHQANLALPDVSEVNMKKAKELAAQYQPKRTLTQFNPFTQKEEKTEVPALDLGKLIAKG